MGNTRPFFTLGMRDFLFMELRGSRGLEDILAATSACAGHFSALMLSPRAVSHI